MKNKNVLIVGIVALIVFVLGCLLLFNKNSNKTKFDLDLVQKEFMKEFKEYDVREFDQYDISMYFGLDFNEIPSSLFISDFSEDPDEPKPFAPKVLIIVINTQDAEDYYDSLLGFVDLNKNNLEDKKLAKKYEKAILKKGKNYVYLLLGDNPKDMEKKLLELAKK